MAPVNKLAIVAAYLASCTYVAALPANGKGHASASATPSGKHAYPSATGKKSASKSGLGPNPTGKPGNDGSQGVTGPVFQQNFGEPSLIQADNVWYAFGDGNNGTNIAMAKSTDFKNWQYLNTDAMPNLGAAGWMSTGGPHNNGPRAPDVIQTADGKFLMQFSALQGSDSTPLSARQNDGSQTYCLGTATADKVEGPYVPAAQPFHCDQSGSDIGSSWFQDQDGSLYVVYKHSVNGDQTSPGQPGPVSASKIHSAQATTSPRGPRATSGSKQQNRRDGPGGAGLQSATHSGKASPTVQVPSPTGNGTPGTAQSGSTLSLLQVQQNTGGNGSAITVKQGAQPKVLMNTSGQTSDFYGPFLQEHNGVYFLTFTSDNSIEYATASQIDGPYQVADQPLLDSKTMPNLNLLSGASFANNGSNMVFANAAGAGSEGSKPGSSQTGLGPQATPIGANDKRGEKLGSATPNSSQKTAKNRPQMTSAGRPQKSKTAQSANPTGTPPTQDPNTGSQPDRQMWVAQVSYEGKTMRIGAAIDATQPPTPTSKVHGVSQTGSSKGTPSV